MADNRVRRLRPELRDNVYIEGNTVRREQEIIELPEEPRKREVSHQVRRNRAKAKRMTPSYVLMLAAATVVAVVFCYQTLLLQSQLVSIKRQIRGIQRTVDDLRMSNDALEDSMTIYTDLDYVYRVATRKLGMVYPTEAQIIRFEKTESEYVRQYEDIPTED